MAKAIYLLAALFLSLTEVCGQYVLDTPDGKKVQLKSDGTWTYVKTDDTRSATSTVPKSSTARYISSNQKYAVWYDPAHWLYDTTKEKTALSWDATFYSKDYAITGYCMDSRLAMPVDDLESFIRPHWQQAGKVTSFTTFKDTINTLQVTGFDMLLEFGGVTYQYRGYVHSSARGSFQLILGTQKEIFEEDKARIEQLFRGITKL